MRKIARYLAIAVAAVFALLLAAAGILAATFNPNDYKPLIIRMVQEKKQRTLHIPGEIKLSFFPKIGADLGKLSISEHNSDAEFDAVDRARWRALLQSQYRLRCIKACQGFRSVCY